MTATEVSDWQDRPVADPMVSNDDMTARLCGVLEEMFDLNRSDGSPKSWEELSESFIDLDLIAKSVGFLKDALSGALYHALPEWSVTFDNGDTLTKSNGTKRTAWDGKRLVSTIAARVSDEKADEDGTLHGPAQIAERVGQALMECAGLDRGSHQWRTGDLKKHGLKPDTYCDSEPGRTGVILKRGEA